MGRVTRAAEAAARAAFVIGRAGVTGTSFEETVHLVSNIFERSSYEINFWKIK